MSGVGGRTPFGERGVVLRETCDINDVSQGKPGETFIWRNATIVSEDQHVFEMACWWLSEIPNKMGEHHAPHCFRSIANPDWLDCFEWVSPGDLGRWAQGELRRPNLPKKDVKTLPLKCNSALRK